MEFRSGSSLTKVCGHCGHFVVRTDRAVEGLGRFAEVAATEHSLALGDRGALGGRGFEVLGQVVLRHPQGGSWEEYHLRFDDGSWSWVTTAQGRWSEVALTRELFARPLDGCTPGDPMHLGAYGDYVVTEVNTGVFESAAGELPFVARPGQTLGFVDLSGENGSVASVHYVTRGGRHDVFVGRAITRADLHLEARAGEVPVQAVATVGLTCRNCGGELPARVDPGALHVVCPYCHAIADHATHAIIARQDAARGSPMIPLGSRGRFDGAIWTVIGYLERAARIEGERFTWSEYLLYQPERGYRWVIADEGVWRMAVPVAAGDIDTTRLPAGVGYRQNFYARRNENEAVVERVLGEFYWRVAVGERVRARDFEYGRWVLSSEQSATECNWTLAEPIAQAELFRALALRVPAESESESESESEPSADAPSAGWPPWVIVALALFALLLAHELDDCDLDDVGATAGGGHGSTWGFGGFGGK